MIVGGEIVVGGYCYGDGIDLRFIEREAEGSEAGFAGLKIFDGVVDGVRACFDLHVEIFYGEVLRGIRKGWEVVDCFYGDGYGFACDGVGGGDGEVGERDIGLGVLRGDGEDGEIGEEIGDGLW